MELMLWQQSKKLSLGLWLEVDNNLCIHHTDMIQLSGMTIDNATVHNEYIQIMMYAGDLIVNLNCTAYKSY